MNPPPIPDMDSLLQRLLDDQLESDEVERLQKAIREDPRVRDYYIDSMIVCAVVRRSSQVTGDLSKSDLMRTISSGAGQGIFRRLGLRIRSVAAILLLGILISVSVLVFRSLTKGPALGTLMGEYEVQWHGSHPRSGELLYAGWYDLREGAVQMELGQGTTVLLEAPCQVQLVSVGEIVVKRGRIAVEVPPQAVGFQVRTSTALITDLGTEFGVIAHSNGSTEAHAFKGRISVAAHPDQLGQATTCVVHEYSSVVIETQGGTVQSGLAAREDLFLRELPVNLHPSSPMERLNLADLVGGGDGRGTGMPDRGVDLATGQPSRNRVPTIQRSQRNAFRPSPQLRGVDGVFVPNGSSGPVVISSTGLTFSECPQTTGSFFSGPTNGGKFYDLPSQLMVPARLNGVHFGTVDHPALTLHPNAGVTFDLDLIRRDHPEFKIARFTAVCGLPKDLPQIPFSAADVWVLLDGIVSVHLNYPPGWKLVETIDLPIPPQARFLTLVATCSGRADYSWVLFGDPFLEPAANEQGENHFQTPKK